MSDSDDTDLLLLIPPDFFLVRSDLEDFDSDIDISFRPEEVKNTIVSDLITQVNDLESRICQIESLERTSTRCSTCNDDSLFNQSIISLTESDVLRAQIKEQKGFLKKDLTDLPFMVRSFKNDIPPGSTIDKDDNVRRCDGISTIPEIVESNTENNIKDTSVNNEHFRTLNSDFDTKSLKTAFQQKPLATPGQLSKEKQTQLLNEVDSFLLNKQLNTSENNELTGITNISEIDPNHEEASKITIDNASVNNHFPSSPKDYELEISDEENIQSLALTEVYNLITEMEVTQNEMQKKLNRPINSSRPVVDFQDKNNDSSGTSRLMKTFGQALDLEDLSTKSPKSLHSKQSGDIMEALRNERSINNVDSLDAYRHGKCPGTNYGSAKFPLSSEEKTNQRTSKTLSPSRTAAGSYNPIDIVEANLPGRENARSSQSGEGKYSPRRSSSFRRQLQFDKPLSPLRASKSKTSFLGEQRSYNPNENQNKNENDRFAAPPFKTSRPVKTNPSLDERFSALTMQRTSGPNYKESQNVYQNFMNKPAGDSLQQKISSNNLLSLSELWNKEPSFYSDDPNKLRQKLEEERYRRQHCEQQIQALQLRVLEEQEKLAVAIRVDQEKDRAIVQITESWKKLNEHWSELEEQRHSLAQQLQSERALAKSKSDELTKKAERWEKEVSQALDLAAGYKEKCEAIQKQMEELKRETEEKLHEANSQLQITKEENKKQFEENQSLREELKALQEQLNEEEDLLSKLKAEVEKSRKRLEEYEAENIILKEQKSSLTTGIKEERNRIGILEQKLNSLQQALNEAQKKERAAGEEARVSQERVEVARTELRALHQGQLEAVVKEKLQFQRAAAEEARVSQERVEVARTELRALYQGQLEAVVKEKLQEFQSQLEAAEAALKAELAAKERQWAAKAEEQYRQLHDKYKRDLLRVEQIHKGDVNSWRERLAESERQRAAVEQRLREEAERRADIAQRLHSVMETQWREALNIISNPVKAMYEMPKEENTGGWPKQRGQSPERLPGVGDGRVSRSNSTTSLGPGEEVPFCREGMVTTRSQPPQDQQLKKYIQMLLERGPGNPVPPQNSQPDGPDPQTLPPSCNDLLDRWIMENEKKSAGQPDRQNQFNKPPWR